MFGFFRARDRAFVVYQMGKVGSATFKNSLERMYGKKECCILTIMKRRTIA